MFDRKRLSGTAVIAVVVILSGAAVASLTFAGPAAGATDSVTANDADLRNTDYLNTTVVAANASDEVRIIVAPADATTYDPSSSEHLTATATAGSNPNESQFTPDGTQVDITDLSGDYIVYANATNGSTAPEAPTDGAILSDWSEASDRFTVTDSTPVPTTAEGVTARDVDVAESQYLDTTVTTANASDEVRIIVAPSGTTAYDSSSSEQLTATATADSGPNEAQFSSGGTQVDIAELNGDYVVYAVANTSTAPATPSDGTPLSDWSEASDGFTVTDSSLIPTEAENVTANDVDVATSSYLDTAVTTVNASDEIRIIVAPDDARTYSPGSIEQLTATATAGANPNQTRFTPDGTRVDITGLDGGYIVYANASTTTPPASPQQGTDLTNWGEASDKFIIYDSSTAPQVGDADIASGGVFWSGQELRVTGGSELDPGTGLQLREWEAGTDRVGTFEEGFELNGSGVAVLETERLASDDYVVVLAENSNRMVQFNGNNGAATGITSDVDKGDATAFEVVEQDLSASWADERVLNGDRNNQAELTIDSNRARYDLIVTAEGLDPEVLLQVFNSGPFDASRLPESDDDYDDAILLTDIQDVDEASVSFQGIDADSYNFTFTATDTTAAASAGLEISDEDIDASFEQSSYRQPAGDVVELTVELEDTDRAYLQFGGETAGFVDILYIEDEDDDGEVTFLINTRTLGTTADIDSVYHSEGDTVESALHGGITTPSSGPTFRNEDGDTLQSGGASGDFTAYVDALELIDASAGETPTDQLTRPPQPTVYDVSVAGNGIFVVNDDEQSELDEELDLAVVELVPPEIENIQTFVASADSADEDDEVSDLSTVLTQRSEVARGDRLVIKVEASGIYGHLVALSPENFDALEDGFQAKTLHQLVTERRGEGVSFEVEADDAVGNQPATALNLGSDSVDEQDIFILADNDAGRMYVIADTGSNEAFDGDVDSDVEFTAEMEYQTDADEPFRFDSGGISGSAGGEDGDTDPAFPYLEPGTTQQQQTTFSITDPTVTFENSNEERIVELFIGGVTNETDATVSGTTNIAPGSDATLQLRSDRDVSPSFARTVDVQISPDGTFSTTVSFTEQYLGDIGEISLRAGSSTVGSADFVITEEQTETPAETPATTIITATDTTTTSDTPSPTPTANLTTEPLVTMTPVSTPTTTPGFGVLLSLIAFLATLVLFTRRVE